MTTSTPVHYQNPLAPTLTLCERLYLRYDHGSGGHYTMLLEAVDDWAYVECTDCLARRSEPVHALDALDAVTHILRTSREPVAPAQADDPVHTMGAVVTRAALGQTQNPGTYVWCLRWIENQNRQHVRVWDEVLGFFTPLPGWVRWQLTMQVDIVGPEDVFITGATVYGQDAAGNTVGHITLREWAQG